MALGHDISRGQRTQDVKISEDVSFDTMLLADNTLKGLRKSCFVKPSPIQLHGIPLGKCGFDLLLEAKSGTGKTAVFAVIALEKLDLTQGLQTIILAPTREIASQIYDVINVIGAYYKGLNVAVVMGGLPVKEDIEKFKENIHIVVGSPGRLRHLIQDKHIDITSVRLFVLDEADKLLEQSFLPDINYIFSLLPKQKQVLMSSATYPEEIKKFIGNYVKKAQHVCPDTNSVLLGIEQRVIIIPYNCNIVKQTKYRYEVLKNIISNKEFKQCLVFCNYQARVAEVHRFLKRDKWPSEQLCGNQDQNDRLDALKTLQEYKCRIMVSTDLAARGIDASNVDLVINFEPPSEWQTYLHRIGRAGRYGSYGLAISILSEGKETSKFKETLVLSKMSFDLKHFGTDEIFNVNLIENKSENNSSETVSTISDNSINYKDLETNAKENDNNNLIGINVQENNFKNELLIEENKTKLEILSFDDLLSSFKNASETKDEPQLEYKHVKIGKIQMSSMKNENEHSNTVKMNTVNKVNHKSKSEIEESNVTKENSVANGEEVQFNRSDKNKYKVVVNTKLNQNKEQVYQNGNIEQDSSKRYNKVNSGRKETEYDDNEQALIDAGLPLAFGKPKHSKKHSNKNKRYFDTRKESNEHNPQINVHNTSRQSLRRSNYKFNNKIYHYEQYSGRSDDLSSDESDVIRQTVQKSRRPQKKVNKNDTAMFEEYNYSQRYNSREQKCKQFDNWYQQLRYQSQFIQYAFYLEELKRL